jgi:16S rRNA (uracil1498-N3)-methyltransferase
MTRIHVPGPLEAGGECALSAAQSHHLHGVLRLKPGDALVLFDGAGAEYGATVLRAGKRGVTVTVGERRTVSRESPLTVTLAQAVSSGERMDYTIQKAVELGAAAIQPLAASRSVVRLSAERADRRASHWQAVAIAACEQCGRNRVPSVGAVLPLDRWLARLPAAGDGARRLLLTPRADARLRDLEPPRHPVILLAGPEGGFTQEEEAAARRSGFVPLSLGPRVLRTETAAVAALAAMQSLWGDA